MKRVKKQYPYDFRTSLGFTTASWVHGFSTMVFSLFLQFLTDYSGIDSAIGQVGYAAAFGTIIIMFTRIVDAVDDPVQAWIMDRSKECKFGKYRRFTLISIGLIAVGITMMFTLPDGVKSSKLFLPVWILAGYIIYEMGYAFNGTKPLIQKTTYDVNLRTKLTTCWRVGIILAVIPASFFIPIATAVNGSVGNMGKSFTITILVITLASAALSLLGVFSLREPYGEKKELGEAEEKLKLREVFQMFKQNKPMWVHCLGFFIGDFAYCVTTAVIVYFLKWFYCADITTGVVNEIRYAEIYGLYAALSLIPNFITPFFAAPLVKKLGSVDKTVRLCMITVCCVYLTMFVLYMLGILQTSATLFVILAFCAAIPLSTAVVPSSLMWTECADYAEYTTGKKMSALVNSVNNLIVKTQNAISAVVPGIILTVVGYSVNAQTGVYAGDLTKLPGMVRNLALVITLIPATVTLISFCIYKFLYPITPEFRQKMTAELEKQREYAKGE